MTKTTSILFWFTLTITASLALYHTSYRVQDLSQQLRELNEKIEVERTAIHVLNAEWVYLANPARIEKAARKHLALQPTTAKQMARLDDMMESLPTRAEAMASITVESTPIANVTGSAKTAATRLAPRPKMVASKDRNHVNVSMVIERSAKPAPRPRTINEILLAADFENSGRRP